MLIWDGKHGYEVVIVPTSIVYHLGSKTIKRIKSLVEFHAVKNSLLLRLTNFEWSFMIRSLAVLFFVSIIRKTLSFKIIKDPEIGSTLPSYKTILSGLKWILKNHKYVISKRQFINSNRVCSTDKLMKMNLITR